jgi:ABC-type nitrate/sulfonate/bicarbonate transport system permease component
VASSFHVNLGIVTFHNVPPPTEVVQSAVVLLKSPKLLAHVSSSLWRVFAGYGAAVVIGIAFGFANGRSRAAKCAAVKAPAVTRVAAASKSRVPASGDHTRETGFT